jgi:hypothetical protein
VGDTRDAPYFTLLEVKPVSQEKNSSKQKIEEELGECEGRRESAASGGAE